MATSVNSSTSTSTLSNLSAKTGMAGLVSGLDTDSLVESMTSYSRSKITKQQQKIQTLQWKQTAYRGISKTLKEFQSKYLDVLSKTNLRSASLYNTVAASTSSTKISVSSTNAANAGNITIDKITQLATNETLQGAQTVSKALSGDMTAASVTNLLADVTAGDKSFVMNLDGNAKVVTLDSAFVTSAGSIGFEAALQKKIDTLFGTKDATTPLIDVALSGDKLSFTATGSKVSVSALGADTTTLGFMGLTDGQSNKINLDDTLENSSFAQTLTTAAADGKYKLSINAVEFTFEKTDKLSTVMSRINSSAADVTLAYSSITDKFSMTAKTTGAGDKLVRSETDSNLLGVLGLTGASTKGQNAILTVNGVEITRSSNTVLVDGINVNLLETSTDPITITSKADSTALKDTIKSFVEDYNSIIVLINKTYKENKDRDYSPLTDEQKTDMSDTEIKDWETKAKQGLLKNDPALRDMASKMQEMMYGSAVSGGISLSDLGITSAGYTENGKLKIDEEKLTAAIETKGAAIQELFTTKDTGLGDKLNSVIQSAVKTTGVKGTRGSLIELAGYESTLSDTENSLTKNITDANTTITKMKASLKDEETRLWKKFTSLETALQQLNTQSSMLTQFSSGS